MASPTIGMSIRISPELHRQLKLAATERGVTVTALAVAALETVVFEILTTKKAAGKKAS